MLSAFNLHAIGRRSLRALQPIQPARFISISSPARNEQVTHIVFFSLQDASDVRKTMSFYETIVEKAKRDNESYILESQCGQTIQHEPIRDGGYNLLSILKFKNDDDRKFFVKQDPFHLELKEIISGKMDKTQMVLDFISGQ